MGSTTPKIEELWHLASFTPNPAQEAAIRHVSGPLYLTAGPGSGKTRVLLWRALNLIVCHDVPPDEIYLSTFTEKAALQLREGLQALLGYVTNVSGRPFDLTRMYVGTVHSLCRRILTDRRFSANRQRARAPRLMDELDQYFHLYRVATWNSLTQAAGLDDTANVTINSFFHPTQSSTSRHNAVTETLALFNRLSEECIAPDQALEQIARGEPSLLRHLASYQIDYTGLEALLRLYGHYIRSLDGAIPSVDFALLQQAASQALASQSDAGSVFRHVIVDEYQDTNTIQERLFFQLAAGTGNLCVVGDDDQALYRFRGATVENFVEFPSRCRQYLGIDPKRIDLGINYRSCPPIVDFYTKFMKHCDWHKGDGTDGFFRVLPKEIQPHRGESYPAVVASTRAAPDDACAEIAGLVRRLIDEGKVQNPNQIAFLFPSLKYRGVMNTQVQRMKEALEAVGLQVYAPRAGRFLDIQEAVDLFGLLAQIIGTPPLRSDLQGDYGSFCIWLRSAKERAGDLMQADRQLARFVEDRRQEIDTAISDYEALLGVLTRNHWEASEPYDPGRMKRALSTAAGLSDRARRSLTSTYLDRIVENYRSTGRPFLLSWAINRAASVDWNILDLFYRICGFAHFQTMFDLAQTGTDEGPICNLGLITQYLARFIDGYVPIITGDILADNRFQRIFFMSYLYALYRRGESEYEDADDPFPKGRIPFLTIHQSKGLEFPVVVLGNPRKDDKGPQRVEQIVRPFLNRQEGEPLKRMAPFDIMRMFYVALSRAKNLLVIAHFKGQGQRMNEPFKKMLDGDFPRIPALDLDSLSCAKVQDERLPRTYSYTADYLKYRQCPREYMIFHKYGFQASRTETMFFGTLVHETLDDLHNYLIARRATP